MSDFNTGLSVAGALTAPTVATADNSTSVATTAYVKAQGYVTAASPALSGIPTAPTAASTDNSTTIATTAYARSNDLGVDQTWQSFVIGSTRISGTTYTNSTSKPILVCVVLIGGAASASVLTGYVGGNIVCYHNVTAPSAGFNSGASTNLVVPAGATYRVDIAGGGTNTWWELR